MVLHPFFIFTKVITFELQENNGVAEMKLILPFIVPVMLFFFGCSSSQETTITEEEEIYVFDEIPEDSLSEEYIPPVQVTKTTKYVVQIGAFTTEDKAQTFANESRKILEYTLNIEFSPDVELFVVQLPPFDTRSEAERVRNALWKNKKFTDAFILSKDF